MFDVSLGTMACYTWCQITMGNDTLGTRFLLKYSHKIALYLVCFPGYDALTTTNIFVYNYISDMKPYRCGSCEYKSSEVNLFIVHFNSTHPKDHMTILNHVLRSNRWKYSRLNYGVVIDDMKANLTFAEDMNLLSIDVDDSPSCTPDAKRRKVVSTPLKESCSAMLSFDDQLDETIPFETDMSDDFESHFSELYINQETQTEETQLLHEMYDLIPGVCDFLITQNYNI